MRSSTEQYGDELMWKKAPSERLLLWVVVMEERLGIRVRLACIEFLTEQVSGIAGEWKDSGFPAGVDWLIWLCFWGTPSPGGTSPEELFFSQDLHCIGNMTNPWGLGSLSGKSHLWSGLMLPKKTCSGWVILVVKLWLYEGRIQVAKH